MTLADEPELMTAEEVARHLRCSPTTVKRLWARGELPCVRFMRRRLIHRGQASPAVIVKLADLLGVPVEAIVKVYADRDAA